MGYFIDEKVNKAKEAQEKWGETSFNERSGLLEKAGALVKNYKEEIAGTISEEMNKTNEEALFDCKFTHQALDFFAEKAPDYLTPEEIEHESEEYSDRETKLYFEPVGVVGAIKPWNFPFDLPVWSCIAPAIMAGNAVVLKPSPTTPKTGQWIERVFDGAGMPEGLLQVIPGGDEVGEELVHSDVDMISFTGSIETGRKIAESCAKEGKKYVLEMGGKDAAIVLDDCDMEETIEGIVFHGFMNNGQACTGIERVLIGEEIYEEFVSKLTKEVEAISPVSFALESQLEVVDEQIQEAIDKGCEVFTGGEMLDKENLLLEPTLVECTDDSLSIWEEETFGPVLAVRPFKGENEAIKIANDTRYGLGTSVWTQDEDKFMEIAKKLEVGMVWQNDANLPFLGGAWVGRKASGVGISLGKYGTRAYTKIKQISSISEGNLN